MTSGRKVLIIDDSAMLLRYASSVLGNRIPDLVVLTARRGGEGFYQADKLRPDLILVNHTLPDISGEALCRRLENHPGTASLPVILLCGRGIDPQTVGVGHPNVVGALTKPFTPEELSQAVHAVLLGDPRPAPAPVDPAAARNRARLQLPLPPPAPPGRDGTAGGDTSRIVFRGTTASFSLKAALLATIEARHPGVLRISPGAVDGAATVAPTEVYVRAGKVLLITSRDPDDYGTTSAIPPESIDALRREQRATGCPPFLALLASGRMPEAEAAQATADQGQKLFAKLWTRPRLDFEFERLSELPEFVRRLPESPPVAPAPEPAGLDAATGRAARLDDWLLGTLRRLRPDELSGIATEDGYSDGVPAYTREGYAAIRQLQLTDLEAAFAQQVDGRADLRTLAIRLGLGAPAAFLLLFRFVSTGLMDLWPAGAMARDQLGFSGGRPDDRNPPGEAAG